MEQKYDCSGWVTRNDLRCSDGRKIKKGAFKHCDGHTVPLVWNHQHNDPANVLGHVLLENREDGVYGYCTFNGSEAGQTAKMLVEHGDVEAFSIYANQLKQQGGDVLHGVIREVSLVLAGANPGALIDTVVRHGEEFDDEATIYTGSPIFLAHADDEPKKEEKKKSAEEPPNSEEKKEGEKDSKTIGEIVDSMNDEQRKALEALVGLALVNDDDSDEDEDDNDDNNKKTEGGNKSMKHNVFDTEETQDTVLSHADQERIITMAKSNTVGSFRAALEHYAAENADALEHGITDIEVLFPEYKDVRPGAPELITDDQGWVGKVLAKTHKSPISRIRTRQADVRNIESMRAKGYKKGKQKAYTGDFGLVRRTTDPQTVYVKSKIDRDDIIDITDFDVVSYLYGIDRMNLNETLALATTIGDGREDGDEGKIYGDKIRPIWLDDELYTIHVDVDIDGMKKTLQGSGTGVSFGDNYVYAESIIQTLLYARENYKGSGTPDFLCTPHLLNVMLLARDMNGRRIYHDRNELCAALNVGEIITAEQFEGKTRTTSDNKTKKLLGLMVNFADYSIGATKGGEITHFNQFDIDFNQEKSLLETRCSGALTRIKSAIALEEDVTTGGSSGSVSGSTNTEE